MISAEMKEELIRKRSEIYNDKLSPAGDSQKTIKKRDVVNTLPISEEPVLSEQLGPNRLENIFEPRILERRMPTPMNVTTLNSDNVSLSLPDNYMSMSESGNHDFIRINLVEDDQALLDLHNSEDKKKCSKGTIVNYILGSVVIGILFLVNDYILISYF